MMNTEQNLDTTTIANRLSSGDECALAELYEAHGAVALGVARRVTRDESLAEDAVQEAFLDLWRNSSSYDPARATIRSWLCVLVHRRAVDIVRREARRRAMDELPTVEPGSYTAEELVVLRYDRRRVQAALGELPQQQREVLELAYWGGLSQSQLATRFDVPIGTIKSRTFAALAALQVALVAA